jgi:uncharacterized protein
MNDQSRQEQGELIKRAKSDLTLRSSALVKRGLQEILPPQVFQLWISASGLPCTQWCTPCFCYRTHEEATTLQDQRGQRMSLQTMEAIVRDMLSYRMEQSVLCWGDCEPTMCGLDFFRAVVAAEKRHGVDGQVIGNALNTNGLLIDDAWCEHLAWISHQ